jgi:hypothetical protein
MDLNDLPYYFRKRPFTVDRMTQPNEKTPDVEAIHHREFQELVATAEQTILQDTSIGVVVWGDPGTGKSHLLTRLDSWARKGNAFCVFLQNIHASPEAFGAYVVKCVVSRLTDGRQENFRETPLFAMIHEVIQRNLAAGETTARPAFERFAADVLRRGLGNPFAELDKRVFRVLWRFFYGAYESSEKSADDRLARLSVRWLLGDRLEPEEARRLNVTENEERQSETPDDEQLLQTLVLICELARGCGKPLVICFDQVDVLDDERMNQYATFLHILLDRARGLTLITCGVQETLFGFLQHGTIRKADWARLCHGESPVQLAHLDSLGARQILEARMGSFHEPLHGLPEVWKCVQDDGLFPLGEDWLRNRLPQSGDVRPRQVIGWAHKRWLEQEERVRTLGVEHWLSAWQSSDGMPAAHPVTDDALKMLIDEAVENRLGEEMTRCELDPAVLPADADNLMGLVEAALRQMASLSGSPLRQVDRVPPPRRNCKPDFDLLVQLRADDGGKPHKLGAVFICTQDKISTWHYLRRLRDDTAVKPDCTLVITDARKPLSLGEAGNSCLAELQASGKHRFLELPFREVAALHSLQKVVNDARSGDLAVLLPAGDLRLVTVTEALSSLNRLGKYVANPLLRSLAAGDSPSARPETDDAGEAEIEIRPFADGDLRKFILAQLALTMGMTASGLATRFAEERNIDSPLRGGLKASMISVAMQMHKEKLLYATPCDDDLSLLL